MGRSVSQEKIDQAKEKILRQANEEAREILQNAKELADETIRVFQKAEAGISIKDLEKSRQKVRDKISENRRHPDICPARKAPHPPSGQAD